jgi:hypothetical protein
MIKIFFFIIIFVIGMWVGIAGEMTDKEVSR